METKMIKIVRIALAATVTAGAAVAGTVQYIAPAQPMIVEETGSMGGSAAWIIPLLAIALIALALSSDNDSNYK